MRLPADATLIVIEAQIAAPQSDAATNIGRLVEAWRAEELPIVHVHAKAPEAGLAAARPGAFATLELETMLDEIGATTLTLCGEAHAIEATAREAAALGFQVFVVADACLEADGGAPSFAQLPKESATQVDLCETLRAAATAKARQRHAARKAK